MITLENIETDSKFLTQVYWTVDAGPFFQELTKVPDIPHIFQLS